MLVFRSWIDMRDIRLSEQICVLVFLFISLPILLFTFLFALLFAFLFACSPALLLALLLIYVPTYVLSFVYMCAKSPLHVHLFTYSPVLLHIHVHIDLLTRMNSHGFVHACTDTRTRNPLICWHMHTLVFICTYISLCTCLCPYMHIFILTGITCWYS